MSNIPESQQNFLTHLILMEARKVTISVAPIHFLVLWSFPPSCSLPCASNPRSHAASIIRCSREMDGIPPAAPPACACACAAEMPCAANVAENSDEDASDDSNIYVRLRFHKWHRRQFQTFDLLKQTDPTK